MAFLNCTDYRLKSYFFDLDCTKHIFYWKYIQFVKKIFEHRENIINKKKIYNNENILM